MHLRKGLYPHFVPKTNEKKKEPRVSIKSIITGARIELAKPKARRSTRDATTSALETDFLSHENNQLKTQLAQVSTERQVLLKKLSDIHEHFKTHQNELQKITSEHKKEKDAFILERFHLLKERDRLNDINEHLLSQNPSRMPLPFPEFKLHYEALVTKELKVQEDFIFMCLLPQNGERVCATTKELAVWNFAKDRHFPLWKWEIECKDVQVHPLGHILALDHAGNIYVFTREGQDTFSHQILPTCATRFYISMDHSIVILSRVSKKEKSYNTEAWQINEKGDLLCVREREYAPDLEKCNLFYTNDLILAHNQDLTIKAFTVLGTNLVKVVERNMINSPLFFPMGEGFIYLYYQDPDRSSYSGVIWDTKSNQMIDFPFNLEYNRIIAGAICPDRKTFILGLLQSDNITRFYFFNIESGLKYQTTIKGKISSFLMHPDGQFSVAFEEGGQKKLNTYDCKHLKELAASLVLPEVKNTIETHFKNNERGNDLAKIVVDYVGFNIDVNVPNLARFFQEKAKKFPPLTDAKKEREQKQLRGRMGRNISGQ